jgi:1,4-dihydroxy-2-naphthoyl-CoA hydrolase
MRIWHGEINTQILNDLNKNSLGEFMEIRFIEVGDNYLIAEMPVNNKTRQPFGLLHGGASVALAETIGSVASLFLVNREIFIAVGVEINASHLIAVTSGKVKAICNPIKVSGKTHVWEIKIFNNQDQLSCVCRFMAMVVKRPIQ